MAHRFRWLSVLAVVFGVVTVRAAEPGYEMAVASGTLVKVDMGKKLTFTPDDMGKAGKQVTLEITADSTLLEVSATSSAGKVALAIKPIKQVDLQPTQKQAVSVIYAKVGDENQLLVLAASNPKLPKGVAVDGVRGIMNKIDADKSMTMQPFIDNKFGKLTELALLPGSKFFEMAPKDNAKRPFDYKPAKLADLTPKRQAISVLFARVNDEPSLLAVVTQPAKDK